MGWLSIKNLPPFLPAAISGTTEEQWGDLAAMGKLRAKMPKSGRFCPDCSQSAKLIGRSMHNRIARGDAKEGCPKIIPFSNRIFFSGWWWCLPFACSTRISGARMPGWLAPSPPSAEVTRLVSASETAAHASKKNTPSPRCYGRHPACSLPRMSACVSALCLLERMTPSSFLFRLQKPAHSR